MYIHNHLSTPLSWIIWKFSRSTVGMGYTSSFFGQLVQHAGKVRLFVHLMNSIEEKIHDLGNVCVFWLVYKSVTKHGILKKE